MQKDAVRSRIKGWLWTILAESSPKKQSGSPNVPINAVQRIDRVVWQFVWQNLNLQRKINEKLKFIRIIGLTVVPRRGLLTRRIIMQ